MSTAVAERVRVGSVAELSALGCMLISGAGHSIAVFAHDGRFFAVDNRCPHKGGPLAEGMLAGDAVVCPLHAFRFEFATGECDQPGTCPVGTYAVMQDGSDIYIAVPTT